MLRKAVACCIGLVLLMLPSLAIWSYHYVYCQEFLDKSHHWLSAVGQHLRLIAFFGLWLYALGWVGVVRLIRPGFGWK